MAKPIWVTGGRTGQVRRFMDLTVFACEGLICVADNRLGQAGNSFTIVTPSEMEERVRAVARSYRNKNRMDLPEWKRREFDEQQQGAQNIVECIKEARAMGDPSDPRVQAFWSRHRRSNTVTLSFSDATDPAKFPKLPKVGPRGVEHNNLVSGAATVIPHVGRKLPQPKLSRNAPQLLRGTE